MFRIATYRQNKWTMKWVENSVTVNSNAVNSVEKWADGGLSMSGRRLAMQAGVGRPGNSSAAKALGIQVGSKESVSAGNLQPRRLTVTWAVLMRLWSSYLRNPIIPRVDVAFSFGLLSTGKTWTYRRAEMSDSGAHGMWGNTEDWVCSACREDVTWEMVLWSTSA